MAEYKQVDLQIGTEAQFESKKAALPIGTIVGITDPIHKSELDSSLQTSIDSITRIYKHEITTTDLQRTLVVINNSSTKITKFTDLLNGNYISMSVKVDNTVTPAVAVSTYNGDSSTVVGIQVRYYSNITEMNYGIYQDSKLSSDTVTTL